MVLEELSPVESDSFEATEANRIQRALLRISIAKLRFVRQVWLALVEVVGV